ncbi:MAG: ABC transporter ATP-binding protein [Caldilineaceae bacterium]|nr:ABC transporter ATP-binding protein [Caldilineaceae bacterium]
MEPYVMATDVRKEYGTATALAAATLTLNPGEILALLGPNGAGKTTLIKILATLLAKDGGQVTVMGYDLDRQPQAIRHLFGYVGQDTERSAYARLTVRENLHFFGALRGMKKAEIEQQIEKLASYFHFTGHLNQLFVQLSGGQKQTVVIMRALLHNPPIIYLDEPTKGLDPLIAQRIRTFLRTYVGQEGKALLLTSHILTEVDELADRVALIHRGRIPLVGTPATLKAAVGANDLIEIEKAQLSPAVQARLQGLGSVLFTLERAPTWLSLAVADPLDGMADILGVLRQAQVRARFRQHTVSLEDAFIHHIGALNEGFEQ